MPRQRMLERRNTDRDDYLFSLLDRYRWYCHDLLDLTNPNAIRVIQIKSDLRDGIIDCELWHSSLNSDYWALSYTWGDANATQPILINGRLHSVRENLWHFLRMARRCFPDKVFWIDAICIAQHDLQEKNHQVQKMSQIYCETTKVIVWLGHKSGNHFGYALNAVNKYDSMNDTQFQEAVQEDQKFWLEFENINYTQYWSRAWIAQEFVLPKRGLIMHGEHWSKLSTFQRVISRLGSLSDRDDSVYGRLTSYINSPAREFWLIRTKATPITQTKSLSPYLNLAAFPSFWGQYRYCSNILDRIYSTFPFTRHANTFEVNYRLNPLELLLESLWLEHDSVYSSDRLQLVANLLVLTPASIVMYSRLKMDGHTASPKVEELVEMHSGSSASVFASRTWILRMDPSSDDGNYDHSVWKAQDEIVIDPEKFSFPVGTKRYDYLRYKDSNIYMGIAVSHNDVSTMSSVTGIYSEQPKQSEQILTAYQYLQQESKSYCYELGKYTATCNPMQTTVYYAILEDFGELILSKPWKGPRSQNPTSDSVVAATGRRRP